MTNYSFSVVLSKNYDFSEEYTVCDSDNTVVGFVSRCDSEVDDIMTSDLFQACLTENTYDCDFDNMHDAVKYLFDNRVMNVKA